MARNRDCRGAKANLREINKGGISIDDEAKNAAAEAAASIEINKRLEMYADTQLNLPG
jgi:hypothetical protein